MWNQKYVCLIFVDQKRVLQVFLIHFYFGLKDIKGN